MTLNKFLYEKEYLVEIGKPSDLLYYFFDYDERSYDINMEFQHFHPFYEMHILLDSEANHIIEGNLYDITLFDIVCLKPYILHKSEYPTGPPRKRLIIQFNLPTLIDLLQEQFEQVMSIFEKPVPIYRFDSEEQDIINGLLNDIFSISKSKNPLRTLLIHNKFTEYLCTLYKFSKNNIYEQSNANTTTSKIYAVASYIHNHYAKDLSLDLLAQEFYLSTYYLSHLFKKVTGFTLINYIQITRTKNAQQLLLYTDTKITEIAEQCGFTSFSQFNRVFNKFCGMSPRSFRQQGGLDSSLETMPTLFTRD